MTASRFPASIESRASWLAASITLLILSISYGALRHPRFLGLREDKTAPEVRRERPISTAALRRGATPRSRG